MAVTKIIWENKTGIQNDASVARKNKVVDEDMNGIKEVVNNNADEVIAMQKTIENLQERQEMSNANITNLQKSQAEQDEEIQVLKNALPSETQESENINIKGTIPTKFKEFVVSGNSKQDGEPTPKVKIEIQNVSGGINITIEDKEKLNQQKETFPLSEGQKLILGDYLAEDGIHNKRKQIELDGNESYLLGNIDNLRYPIKIDVPDIKIRTTELDKNLLSNSFVADNSSENTEQNKEKYTFRQANGGKNIWFFIPKDFFETTTSSEIINEWKQYLATQKSAGTPVIIEYELAEEETESYTEEQQEAYNSLLNLKSYEEETNVYSENEVSPIFKVTAVKDVNSVIT